MSYIFSVASNAIKVTDSVTGEILLDEPTASIYYDENTLESLSGVELVFDRKRKYNQRAFLAPLADCLNGLDSNNPFTENSFINFANTYLGASSGGGGGGGGDASAANQLTINSSIQEVKDAVNNIAPIGTFSTELIDNNSGIVENAVAVRFAWNEGNCTINGFVFALADSPVILEYDGGFNGITYDCTEVGSGVVGGIELLISKTVI